MHNQCNETALKKWRMKLRNRKIRHILFFVVLIAIYWLIIWYLWKNAEGVQTGFASFMGRWFGGVVTFFSSSTNNITDFFVRFFNIGFIVLYVILFLLLMLGVWKIKMKIKENWIEEYAHRFRNIGLVNKQGEALQFRNKKPDPNKVSGEVYTFNDADVDFGKFNDPAVIRGLRNIFHGTVRPEPGSVYGETQFFVEPSAKTTCKVLSVKDTWIARNIIHCALFGSPGKGKTTGMAYLIYLYCLNAEINNTNLEIHLFDQKMSFAEKLGVSNSNSFHYGLAVLDGLEKLMDDYAQIKLLPDGIVRVICIDEYITLIDRLDRRQSERVRTLLGILIFEAREFGYRIILAGQASHAERFGSGVRDSLTSKIFFGNASETEKRMLFPDDIGLMDAHNDVGEGYMLIDGMSHVERFSIVNTVPDFAIIGEKVKRYMA